jgi:hypothetical protein
MGTTLTAAIVAAIVSAVGWTVAQIVTLNKEGVAREVSIRLRVLERQIEEFYGPLFGLTNQIRDAWAIRDRLMKTYIVAFKRGIEWNEGAKHWNASDEERKTWPFPSSEIDSVTSAEIANYRNQTPVSTVRYYALEQFIYPLYDQATEILSKKLHLLGHPDIPASYREFMIHALQNRFQNRLYIDKALPSNFTTANPYPQGFTEEIEHSLSRLMQEYAILQGQVVEAANWRSLMWRRFLESIGIWKR